MIDRDGFFSAVSPLFSGGKLSRPQRSGIDSLLDRWQMLYPDADVHWIANCLAQVYHETGGRMVPVRETFANSDEVAKSRLERAWRSGRMPWVKNPYWRDGYFGRGHIQLTHERNYAAMGTRIGYDLRADPALMLDPAISAQATVIGMVEGLFTGRKLADYAFPGALDAKPDNHPRRIVNGPDGTDAKIAALHRKFLKGLQ